MKTTTLLLALVLVACRVEPGGDGWEDGGLDGGDCELEADVEYVGHCCIWGVSGHGACYQAVLIEASSCMVYPPSGHSWLFTAEVSEGAFPEEWHEEIRLDAPCSPFLGACLVDCY